MKKILYFIILVFIFINFSACINAGDTVIETPLITPFPSNTPSQALNFNINFDVDGETINTITTKGNELITLPLKPKKDGFIFTGWYRDKDTWQTPFNENSLYSITLINNITVYAKWVDSCNVYIASSSVEGGIYHYTLKGNGDMQFNYIYTLKTPLYLAKNNNRMYAVLKIPFNGNNKSGVVNFDILQDGSLYNMSSIISTQGVEGCHVTAIDNDIYCVNYSTGNIIKMPDSMVTHQGAGTDLIRQSSPHPHQIIVTSDSNYVCAVDLGVDKIFVYDRDLRYVSEVKLADGAGPRHIAFYKNIAYCANELDSSVTVLRYNNGNLTVIGTYTTLPQGYNGERNYPGAIRVSKDGRFLYITNRGQDKIARFAIDGNGLQLLDWTDCGGTFPRDFNFVFDEQYAICTNQTSNNVTLFKVIDGVLNLMPNSLTISTPVCIIDSVN